jgi:peptidoglycan/LPS O-acetylase OafA/YrhL
MHSTPQRAHLRSLTGLRFYAALLVVLFHFSRHFDSMAATSMLFGFGYVGVSFFFVLSGFVLAWSQKPDESKRVFYWRRFARVWPLHALTATLAVPVIVVMGGSVLWPALPFVATLSQAWIPPGNWRFAFNGPSWSLACEAFFYLLFPFLIGRVGQQARLAPMIAFTCTAMVIVAAAGIFVAPDRALGYLFYTMPPFRLGEFVIGICLAVAFQRGWRPRFTLNTALLLAMISYTMLMAGTLGTLGSPENLPYVVANLWLLPGCVAVIAAAAAGDLRGKAGHLRSERVVRLGYWSFALYLVHELVIKLAIPTVESFDLAGAVFACIVLLAISVALAGVLHEFFEAPVEKRFRCLLTNRQATPASHSS